MFSHKTDRKMMSVSATANNIIRNSILSSIYIDDKIVEPYDLERINTPEFGLTKGVYESFRKAQKSIDFYRYNPNSNWIDDQDYIFKNRDLLILDWDLAGNDALEQPATLQILEKAVHTDSLHFISIYTGKEKREFQDIIYLIKSFFSKNYNNINREKIDEIITELDAESIERKFFEGLMGKFKESAFTGGEKQKAILSELKDSIRETLGNRLYPKFSKSIKDITGNLAEGCELLGYAIHNIAPNQNLQAQLAINTGFTESNFIVIGHTIIQVTSKKNPEPTELLNFFTEATQSVCGNLLTLVTLEIRNLLRESSGFIGKGADEITDSVLFHQWKKKKSFFEFLMTIFKSHTVSHFDYKQGKLKSLHDEFWTAYEAEKGITQKVEDIIKPENDGHLVKELLKLNLYYNVLHVKRSDHEKIKFGDVFTSIRNGNPDGGYFLCITAHCDCLTPGNIRNNFYFVRGEAESTSVLVKKGDDVFCTYLSKGNEVIGVRWDPRPVVLRIANSELSDNKVTGVDGADDSFDLIYSCTIKESYAQRMANNSFAHAMRVGIDFAKFE